MTEHRLLTGASLHEPKGVETASAGQVYVSDGAGSGKWVNQLAGIYNLNAYSINGVVPDLSKAGSSFFASVAVKSVVTNVFVVLNATITGSNATLTIYKNGIAQSPTFSIPSTGSGPGVQTTFVVSPSIACNPSDVLEVRTTTATGSAASAAVSLRLTATS